MTDENKYPVSGNVEFLVSQGFVDGLKYDDTIKAVFGQGTPVNIRRAKDKKIKKDGTKPRYTLPALSIECIAQQTLGRTNEYHGRVMILAETQADNDDDGQQVEALIGAVRDCLHKDSATDFPGHFDGDCLGFVNWLNENVRGFVFHQLHEIDTDPDDEKGRVRRMTLKADVWGYPGRRKK